VNVSSRPPLSTAVHWETDGHASSPDTRPVPSIVVGVGSPGALGLKVSSRPSESIAVHWDTDGHASASREYALALATPNATTATSAQGKAANPANLRTTAIAPPLLI
jgi:hypothetical protein